MTARLDGRERAPRLEPGLRGMIAAATDEVWIPAAEFRMGSDAHYADEAPTRRVAVDGFWIDRFQVTNRRFAVFVAETGYATVAERPLDPAAFPDAPAENLAP